MSLSKIITPDQLSSLDRNHKIVFTNGCFDLLHKGHLHLIREAKKYGDVLIVGVNDDASVKRLKGNARPVEDQQTRMEHLAELEEVDYVISFSDDTPIRVIEAMKPDVLIKGGDYKEEDIVGAQFVKKIGGKVRIVPLLEGYSTTNILNA